MSKGFTEPYYTFITQENDGYEYTAVYLPDTYQVPSNRLMTEKELASLRLSLTYNWNHYKLHKRFTHIILLRRPIEDRSFSFS
mmetsp:Transcript_1366/g.1307  ORF Transcript_1366/g.1307 Transcript_1366/m.1307 type:complete len:83 (-) Transcript_1366:295-543(-)